MVTEGRPHPFSQVPTGGGCQTPPTILFLSKKGSSCISGDQPHLGSFQSRSRGRSGQPKGQNHHEPQGPWAMCLQPGSQLCGVSSPPQRAAGFIRSAPGPSGCTGRGRPQGLRPRTGLPGDSSPDRPQSLAGDPVPKSGQCSRRIKRRRGPRGTEGSGAQGRRAGGAFEHEKELARGEPRGGTSTQGGVCVWRGEDLGEPRG